MPDKTQAEALHADQQQWSDLDKIMGLVVEAADARAIRRAAADSDMELHRKASEKEDAVFAALHARLRAVIGAPTGGELAWRNDAAVVLARFISLSSTPDQEQWGRCAALAIQLLGTPEGQNS